MAPHLINMGSESGLGESPNISPFDVDKMNEIFNAKYNFSDVAFYIFRPSEMEFRNPPGQSWLDKQWLKGALNNIYYIRNKETLSNVLNKLITMAQPETTTTQVSTLGTTLVPWSTSNAMTKNTKYIWSLNPVSSSNDKNVKPSRRPTNQERDLAAANCGPSTGKFKTFAFKHIIEIPDGTLPEELGRLSYLETIRRRIGEAIQSFTFFLKTAHQSFDYLFYEFFDDCYSTVSFPTYTCKRYNKEDHVIGCFSNGNCQPTYKHSTGHLTQLMCESGSALGSPDYAVPLEEMHRIQSEYISALVRTPPTHYDWLLSSWKARSWAATNRGEPFLEPKPAYERSERELCYEHYAKLLRQASIAIPEEIKRLFFALPKFYFPSDREMRRDPQRPNCGVVTVDDVVVQACPGHETVDFSLAPYNWGEVILPVNNAFIGPEVEHPDLADEWAVLGQDIIRLINNLEEQRQPE
jgi:hypothetical protein